jgi:hypothetical protein
MFIVTKLLFCSVYLMFTAVCFNGKNVSQKQYRRGLVQLCPLRRASGRGGGPIDCGEAVSEVPWGDVGLGPPRGHKGSNVLRPQQQLAS